MKNTADYVYSGWLNDNYSAANHTGSLALVKDGSGPLTLSGSRIYYYGGTTVTAGNLVLQNTTDSGFLTKDITNNANLTFDLSSGTSSNYSGVISGSGTVYKTGPGSLTFSGSTANAYGDTIVQQGTLVLGKDAGVHAIAGNITLGKSTGGTSTDAAHLKLTADGQIADNSVVTLYGASGGALYLQNHSATVAGISGDAAAQISNGQNGDFSGAGTLTVKNTADYSYSGWLNDNYSANNHTGSLALVKDGWAR